ncbi:MAG: hypothetical protein ACJ73S_05440 [Mycobacteriales bacterium]
MTRHLITVVTAAAALAAAAGCSTGKHHGSSRPAPKYTVSYQPADFTADVTNPWFPLRPGTTQVYRGEDGGRTEVDNVTATTETVTIGGVPCRVVRDQVYVRGVLTEDTRDYYTQDSHGTVWYFGEDTAELDKHGKVTSREGTWRTGRNGALPGVFMPAAPTAGERHRQEYYRGHAEDFFQVLTASGAEVVTREWSPLEPDVEEHKTYRRGTGLVDDRTVRGGDEHLALAEVRPG